MQQKTIQRPEMLLLGIAIRTNNQDEADPVTAKISPTAQKYFQELLFNQIPNRKMPGHTYCVYTENWIFISGLSQLEPRHIA